MPARPIGARAAAAAHHREQSSSDRCVPACASIVLSWLGRPTDEEAICRGWVRTRRGYAIVDAAELLDGAYDADAADKPGIQAYLRILLAEPRWIVAQMFSAPMTRIAASRRPPSISRFGPLTTARFGALHAVVLVDADDRGFYYLDPYYPGATQPFFLTNEELAEAWQGAMLISGARP